MRRGRFNLACSADPPHLHYARDPEAWKGSSCGAGRQGLSTGCRERLRVVSEETVREILERRALDLELTEGRTQ